MKPGTLIVSGTLVGWMMIGGLIANGHWLITDRLTLRWSHPASATTVFAWNQRPMVSRGQVMLPGHESVTMHVSVPTKFLRGKISVTADRPADLQILPRLRERESVSTLERSGDRVNLDVSWDSLIIATRTFDITLTNRGDAPLQLSQITFTLFR